MTRMTYDDFDTTGVDKVKLHTTDFTFRDVTRAGVQLIPGQVDLTTGQAGSDVPLFRDQTGRTVNGSRVVRNTDLYNLTVNGYGLTLQFNPSKPYHPFNLVHEDHTFDHRVMNVVDDLEANGIIADWYGAKVTRLDVARNVTLNQPVRSYSQVWNWLQLKRAKNVRQYPDGYGSGNNSWGVILYDKGKETAMHGTREYNGEDLTRCNLLRCELQLKRGRAVQTNIGCKTLDDVRRLGMTDLTDLYKKHIETKVLRSVQNLTQYTFDFNDHLQLLQILKDESERSAIARYFQIISVPTFLEHHDVDRVTWLMTEAGFSRVTINKWVKTLRENLAMYAHWHNKHSTVGTMLRELQYKLAA